MKETDFTVIPDVDVIRFYDQNNGSKVSMMENLVSDETRVNKRVFREEKKFHWGVLRLK